MFFAVYSPTGEILRSGTCEPDSFEGQGDHVIEVGPEAIQGLDSSHYVLAGVLTERPSFDVQDQEEVNLGSDLELTIPTGTRVTLDSQDLGESEDGTLVIQGDMPAEYEVTLEKWPYIKKAFKVIVHED